MADYDDDIADVVDFTEGRNTITEEIVEKIEEPKDEMLKIARYLMNKYQKPKTEIKNEKKDTTIGITNSNVHAAYAMIRIKNSDGLAKWSPKMLEIKHYIDTKYDRKILCTELTFPMMELCLNLPIQYDVIRGNTKISLNNPDSINYEDKCFENAIEIISDLYNRGIIKKEELRIPYDILVQRGNIIETF